MVDLQKPLTWLTVFEVSNLNSANQKFLTMINSGEIDASTRNDYIKMFKSAVGSSSNPKEQAEGLVNIGVFYAKKREPDKALEVFNQALDIYPVNSHDKAVVHWMAGKVYQEITQSIQAYSNFREARRIFELLRDRLGTQTDKLSPNTYYEWYGDRLYAINLELMMDSMDELYTFFDQFNQTHQSRITGAAISIRDQLRAQISARDFRSATLTLQTLTNYQTGRLDLIETGQIKAFCALSAYQMGQITSAVKYMRLALQEFVPEKYYQAVAGWMLGILLWQIPHYEDEAIRHWQKSYKRLAEYKAKIDTEEKSNKDKAAKMKFLEEKLKLMEDAQKRKIQNM